MGILAEPPTLLTWVAALQRCDGIFDHQKTQRFPIRLSSRPLRLFFASFAVECFFRQTCTQPCAPHVFCGKSFLPTPPTPQILPAVFCISCAIPVENPSTHILPPSPSAPLCPRCPLWLKLSAINSRAPAFPQKSPAIFFLNCTKNAELTARLFARTFTLASQEKSGRNLTRRQRRNRSSSTKIFPTRLAPNG
jgi:hypothetical protein